MMAILLFHTEVYYCGHAIIPYYLYVLNALCIFFILSGYLLFKDDNLKHKLYSIFRGLFIPYFIFTSIIALLKSFFYGDSLREVFREVILGQASWFVTTLIVAELIFIALLHICRRKEWMLLLGSLLFLAAGILVSGTTASFIWTLGLGLVAVFLLFIGWAYHKHEAVIGKFNGILSNLILFAILVFLKVYESHKGIELEFNSVSFANVHIFIVEALFPALLLINISKNIILYCKNNLFLRAVQWTGSHSLIYYFFCGAVPKVVSTVFIYLGICYNGNYLLVVLNFAVVYAVTSLVAFIVYKYFPYTIGRKK